MISRRRALRSVALLAASSPALAQTPPAARPSAPRSPEGPLSVHIDAPTAGIVEGSMTVALEATVSDARLRNGILTVNGASYEVPIEGGRVRQTVVVLPGNNRVAVSVTHDGHTVSDSRTFYLHGDPTELVVLLAWPSRGEIIDLWVREPGGETCKWNHRETRNGGRLLDFSSDAIGFGSQGFVAPRAVVGRYRLKVHYWSARGGDDERGTWTYDQAMRDLDAAEHALAQHPAQAERERLLAQQRRLTERLDRWAEPGAPQTPVHAEAVLFGNTVYERRWRFEVTPQRTGELVTLGDIEISDEMIREARSAR